MTLATHAVIGAAIAQLFPTNPILAGCFAFGSHFVLDAIPHWDYRLRSSVEDNSKPLNNDIKVNGSDFAIDLLKISSDFGLGIVLAIILFYPQSSIFLLSTLVGAVCAMLPDPLQFVYMKFRREPLVSLQRFHMWMHAKLHLKGKPLIGVVSQVVLIMIAVGIARFLIKL